ncbi:MAG: FAD binding domain-containing protein [Thermanaerothrix sp.]|nr:FAD binding domain-containing protein [Thermanaerothrix sp.]
MLRASPRTLAELTELALDSPKDLRYIAGGTDLTVKMHREGLGLHLMDVTRVEGLRDIERQGSAVRVGAAVPFADISLGLNLPKGLSTMASKVGSPQIRSRGTMGGNVGNLSPAGDSIPMLMALEASMEVLHFENTSPVKLSIPMGEIKSGPFGVLRGPKDLITGFVIPPWEFSFFGKVGSRRTVTISKVNLACALSLAGNRCRVYMGAVGRLPVRCPRAEEAIAGLSGTELQRELPRLLSQAVEEAIPSRASMPYKREAVKALGLELALELAHGRGC